MAYLTAIERTNENKRVEVKQNPHYIHDLEEPRSLSGHDGYLKVGCTWVCVEYIDQKTWLNPHLSNGLFFPSLSIGQVHLQF